MPVIIPLWQPVINAAVAGSATALGGALVLLLPTTPSDAVIGFTLSFAAGVMVTVSIADLWLPTARLSVAHFVMASVAVGVGAVAALLLSRLPIPDVEDVAGAIWGLNHSNLVEKLDSYDAAGDVETGESEISKQKQRTHSPPRLSSSESMIVEEGGGGGRATSNLVVELEEPSSSLSLSASSSYSYAASPRFPPTAPPPSSGAARARAWRLGFLLWVVLTVHNLPEGLAVGVSSVKSKELGVMLAGAIFLHNVAEGVVIAVPLLAATGDRALALGVTAASGLSEPVGALAGVLLLRGFAGERGTAALEAALNLILCSVGGVMLGVSRFELIPQALRIASPAVVAQGFMFGSVLIGSSLYFLPI